VVLAAAGALCIAFSGVLVRLADVEPSTAAFYRCAYAVQVLGVLALWERRRYGPREPGQARLAWLAGAFFAADLIFWHHAIAAVGAGLATVLGNVQVVLVGLVAWAVLGERPDRHLLAAVPIVFGGIVLISGVLDDDAYGSDPALGVLFGLLTAVAYSAFLLVLRAGVRDVRRPASALFDATLAAALLTLPAGWALGELDFAATPEAHAWLVTLALTSQVLGWLLITTALPRVPAALTSVVITLQPVCSVVLAMILLDEDPSALQLLGIGVVIGGIVLATVGGRPEREAPAG
jgi:drug/metabolite transporter (DMT)-like permease